MVLSLKYPIPELTFYSKSMVRWYFNHCGTHNKKAVSVTPPVISKPRATNALELWGQGHTEDVELGVGEKMSEGDHAAPGENLKVYWDVKRTLFNALSDGEKEDWVAKAAEHNEHLKNPPSSEYIDK